MQRIPEYIKEYTPILGFLLLITALILEIVSAFQFKQLDPGNNSNMKTSNVLSFKKYHNLAIVFSIVGFAFLISNKT